MNVCEVVIFITLVVTSIIVFVQIYIRRQNFDTVILMALSLVIASVPVALPMVMQVSVLIDRAGALLETRSAGLVQ